MSAQAVSSRSVPDGDTRGRILDAAELLFVTRGADGMSLRAVTTAAAVNIAAVNYHFGSKHRLVEALLARRLDPLNRDRGRLLDACERRRPGGPIGCAHVLGAMFVPALRLAGRSGADPLPGLRFFGRAYSDPSDVTARFVRQRYEPVAGRFSDAFARALPHLPRADLGLRLAVVLRAVAGFVAGPELPELLAGFARGGGGAAGRDRRLLSSLGSLMSGALGAPLRADGAAFAEMFALADSLGDGEEPEAAAVRPDPVRDGRRDPGAGARRAAAAGSGGPGE